MTLESLAPLHSPSPRAFEEKTTDHTSGQSDATDDRNAYKALLCDFVVDKLS
jgi:hypothetical protein